MICNLGDPMSLRHPVSTRHWMIIEWMSSYHSYEKHDSFTWKTWLIHWMIMHEGVMSHISTSHENAHLKDHDAFLKAWLSHVSHINESCLSYQRVMSHISTSHENTHPKDHDAFPKAWLSHVSHINESCLSNQWGINESCLSCKWFMFFIWMTIWRSHVSHINKSRKRTSQGPRFNLCLCTCVWVCNDSFIRDMTHACMTWLIHVCHDIWETCVTYGRHVSSHTWMSHMSPMWHMNESHVSHVNVTCLPCERFIWETCDSFIHVCHTWMSHMSPIVHKIDTVWHDTCLPYVYLMNDGRHVSFLR